MFNKLLTLLIILLLPSTLLSQSCEIKVEGFIKDANTGSPLELVNIYVEENGQGAVSDSLGYFKMENFCPGHYHLVLSHVGCQAQFNHIDLEQDTSLLLLMDHTGHNLEGITVTGEANKNTTQSSQAVSPLENSTENLSNILSAISGVSSLKSGNGIAKPVVHGLYGNRITILNNGIAQSGQQWGNDHSPEIDPLVANKLRVIKGVSTLEYPGSNLGSVILVEPNKILREPHLHGKVSYFFESNGLNNGLNISLQQYDKKIGWKAIGTLKRSGDKMTPNYYLNNTGHQEANLALQFEKSYHDRLFFNLYTSTFNTIIGVLRGAHIGNLTDLQTALERSEPFFTEEKFSYDIEAPKQEVNHHLVKLNSKYFLTDEQWIELTLAGQINIRKEFDVRRSGRTEIPALSLAQHTYYLGTKYQRNFQNDFSLKLGGQLNIIDNTNNPETGIFPLIPDYIAYESGAYALANKSHNRSLFELGIRYDYIYQYVVTFTRSSPVSILRYNNHFQNISASLGWKYQFTPRLNLSYNVGYATRNPAINELYSNGLHQGVSGIEEGSIDLNSEKSIKTTISLNGILKEWISFEGLAYYQNIQDYIFLNPQDEFRLTIRGAFPVFKYEQTNAQIYGLDLSAQIQLSKSLQLKGIYSYLKGTDLNNNLALINLPANNISANLSYEFLSPVSLGKKQLENFTIELSNQYVFKQNALTEEQDFTASPNAYYLLGTKLSTDIQFSQIRLNIFAKVDNLLNTSYRDYLNRQRYFADDLGRNISFGISWKF